MEVNDPDLDAFESASLAQLQARELGKIEAFIPNLWYRPNFRVNGTAWTFSCTIGVDPCCDESCNLVKIAGVKFMEAQAPNDRPPAIQYLSVHCDISPLVQGPQFKLWGGNEGSSALLAPNCHNILEFYVGTLASWLPVASVEGGLCCNKEFKKAQDEISPGWDKAWHWSSCRSLSMVWNACSRCSWRNNAGRRAARASSSSSGSIPTSFSSCQR